MSLVPIEKRAAGIQTATRLLYARNNARLFVIERGDHPRGYSIDPDDVEATETLVPVYSDSDGTDEVTQPVLSDPAGRWSYWVDDADGDLDLYCPDDPTDPLEPMRGAGGAGAGGTVSLETVSAVMDHSAVGDGSADDTTHLQNFLNAIDNGTAEGYVGPGTFMITGGLLTGNGDTIRLKGAGMHLTTIKVASASAAEYLLNLSNKINIEISDLTLDCNHVDNVVSALYGIGNVTRKNMFLNRVQVINCVDTGTSDPRDWKGINIWPCKNVTIRDCEILDCGIGMFLDDCDGEVKIVENTVRSSTGLMANGIQLVAGSGEDHRSVLIQGNTITGAQSDPSDNGIDGQGINLYRSRGVRVIGNHIGDCETSGVLVGDGCFGTQVVGNDFWNIKDMTSERGSAVYVETEAISLDETIGSAGDDRPVTVVGNNAEDCYVGITCSYSAACTVKGNTIKDMEGDGIVLGAAPFSSVSGNIVMNCYKSAAAPPQLVKAGIRAFLSGHSTIQNNVCTDNQASKTQDYGIAVEDDYYTLGGNQLSGNAVEGLYVEGDGDTVKRGENHFGGSQLASIARASTITIPPDAKVVNITGTSSTIATINGGWIGRIVLFKIDPGAGTITFDSGAGNMALGSDLPLTAFDTLCMFFDGTSWWEMSHVNI